ncbi:MAG TPA: universal stress protein [Hanamia sp.]|nr:universal stress protein [Hanamia sp.]
MKRILVPVDFSPTSKKTFKFAIDIASKSGGSVLLYHLYVTARKTTPGLLVSAEEYNKQLALTCLKKLKRLKKEIMKEATEVPISIIIGHSPVVYFTRHKLVNLYHQRIGILV